MRVVLLIGFFAIVLWAIIANALGSFRDFGAEISIHGWIALALGTILSIALGGGLMWLSFYSARKGFDERAQPKEEDEP
ncbi:MAG: hypothetical protein AB7L65_01230 [Hyphomonadaceae bacterium]